MNRPKTKRALAAGALATFAMAAAAPSAADGFRDFMARETYKNHAEGRAPWENQGAGERTKCFDCLKQRGAVGQHPHPKRQPLSLSGPNRFQTDAPTAHAEGLSDRLEPVILKTIPMGFSGGAAS